MGIEFHVTCSLTDVAVGFANGYVLNFDCFASNVIPLPVFPSQFDGRTVLDSTPVVRFSRGPVGEVKRFAEVVPHPRSVVEDVGQPDPEAKMGVAIPTPADKASIHFHASRREREYLSVKEENRKLKIYSQSQAGKNKDLEGFGLTPIWENCTIEFLFCLFVCLLCFCFRSSPALSNCNCCIFINHCCPHTFSFFLEF